MNSALKVATFIEAGLLLGNRWQPGAERCMDI